MIIIIIFIPAHITLSWRDVLCSKSFLVCYFSIFHSLDCCVYELVTFVRMLWLIIAGTHLPIAEVPPRPATRLTGVSVNGSTNADFSATTKAKSALASNESTETKDSADSPEVTVCHLPPFCWSPAHVIYWLSEYACLPGGCVAAAERIRLDGKQLTTLSGNKADKLLCLR